MLVLMVFTLSLAVATGVAGRLLGVVRRRDWPAARRLGDALAQGLGLRREPPPEPEVPVELLICTLELQRLSRLVQRAHACDQPGKYERVRASEGAYDDVLLRTCRVLGVDEPEVERTPLTTMQRFDAETALMAGGVHW
jgi:hypothetical protein